jgi:hypothetical protein
MGENIWVVRNPPINRREYIYSPARRRGNRYSDFGMQLRVGKLGAITAT